MKRVDSLRQLLLNILHQNRILFSTKKGYRTTQVSNKELQQKISNVQELFKKSKLKKGDCIILLGANSVEWIAVYFASFLSGIVPVPLDVTTDASLLKKIQKQVKAKIIFFDRGLSTLNIKKVPFL